MATKPKRRKGTPARRRGRQAEGRATLENPKWSLSDPNVWDNVIGGERSDAGINVTRDTALTYSPVWRAVSLISGDVAKLPLVVYRREGPGKERAPEHAAYQLLRYKANREMRAKTLKRLLIAHALLGCGGYAYIARRGDAVPLELLPLNPDRVHVVRENRKMYYALWVGGDAKVGDPIDDYAAAGSELRRLLPENVLHIQGLSFDGFTGYDLVKKGRNCFGLGLAGQKFQGKFFWNDATPNVVIKHPKTMTPAAAANFLGKWNAAHQGLDNSHKAALLQEGMDLAQYSTHARNAQLIETRLHELIEVANFFDLPPHKLGHPTRTAYASLEEENQSYLDQCLDQWLTEVEDECRDKLLTEDEKRADSHVIEFNRGALLRANLAAQGEYFVKALAGRPWMIVDEVRGLMNLNPLPDDIGQKYEAPTNNFSGATNPGGAAAAIDTDDDDADGERDAAIETLFRAAVTRMAKRLATHAPKSDWPTKRTEHRSIVAEALEPIGRLAGAGDGDVTNWLFSAVENRLAQGGDVSGLADDAAHIFLRGEPQISPIPQIRFPPL